MNILIPDSWLREYLDTPATPSQIKTHLSLCGPTIDRINSVDGDFIYDVEITSNRVDMASVHGIAREARAILPRFGIPAKLKAPRGWQAEASAKAMTPPMVKESRKELSLTVSDPDKLCDRLLALVIDGVKVGESPKFMKDRLEKSGIRSLNNLIDITNYVMLELGHPCHVFDYDRIKTAKLILRKAKRGEKLVTLDNKEFTLEENDVIIDDGTGRIIDLPGIIGTANSVVTDATKRIVLFIESNNPLNIRKTSMRLGTRTLAATLNEKHPDPDLAKTTFLRAMKLFQEIASVKLAGKIIDIYPNPPKIKTVNISSDFINQRLGVTLKTEEMKSILESLEFQVKILGSQLAVTPPSFRQFDISIPEDIVEEVARIYGYHNLPSRIMSGEIPVLDKQQEIKSPRGWPKDSPDGGGITTNPLLIENKLKNILKYWGYTETYHYSFVSQELIEKSGLKTEDHLRLSNSLTPETEYMRTNLIPSMLDTIVKNQAYRDRLQLFELAKIYVPPRGWQAGAAAKAMTPPTVNSLPSEISMLTITNQTSLYHLKGIVEGLLKELGISGLTNNPMTNDPMTNLSHFFHPQQTLQITKDKILLATIGKLHPSLSTKFALKKDTYIAYLNVENIIKVYNPLKKFTPIPQYPAIIEDITIQIKSNTQIGLIIDNIYEISNLVKNVELIDRYKNKVTLRISYQDPTKNLTTEDIETIREEIIRKEKVPS
ncbi:phenylalanine--tRNA ligase subunit beta [Candidatus Gottesmanbacteria bacterium]|nr:phenylalanine--tRNA ligase subunit beta [Candidatus Gottesmanbacteria bacterium]